MGTSNPIILRRNAHAREQAHLQAVLAGSRAEAQNDLRDTQALVRDLLRAQEEQATE